MDFTRLWHWQRFEPNLGDNLEVPEPARLYLEVAVGLTKVELTAFLRGPIEADGTPEQAAIAAFWADVPASESGLKVIDGETSKRLDELKTKRDTAYAVKLASLWSPFVKLGPGQHAINGKPLTGLVDYLAFVGTQAGRFNLLEIVEEVQRHNSVAGTRALFSSAPFGGPTGTRPPSGAKEGNATAGR